MLKLIHKYLDLYSKLSIYSPISIDTQISIMILTKHLVWFLCLSHSMDMLDTSACIQALQFTHHKLSTEWIQNIQRILAVTIDKRQLVPKACMMDVIRQLLIWFKRLCCLWHRLSLIICFLGRCYHLMHKMCSQDSEIG